MRVFILFLLFQTLNFIGLEAAGQVNQTPPAKNNGSGQKAPDSSGKKITVAVRTPSTVQATGTIRALTAFSVQFNTSTGFTNTSGAVEFINQGRYNKDQQHIRIQREGITLTKGGLYRFSIFFQAQLQLKSYTTLMPWLMANLHAGGIYEILYEQFPAVSINPESQSNQNFFLGKLVTLEVYVPAGTTISIRGSVENRGTGSPLRSEHLAGKSFYGYLNGYLVEEF